MIIPKVAPRKLVSLSPKRMRDSVTGILTKYPPRVKGYCARWARGDGGLSRELCEHPHHDEGHLRSRRGRIGADRTEHEQLFNIAQRPDARVRENVEGRFPKCCHCSLPATCSLFLFYLKVRRQRGRFCHGTDNYECNLERARSRTDQSGVPLCESHRHGATHGARCKTNAAFTPLDNDRRAKTDCAEG